MRPSSFGIAFAVFLGVTLGVPWGPHEGLRAAVAQPVSTEVPATVDTAPTEIRRTTVMTDPVSGERYVEVRPTAPIERGRWAVPPWLIWCLAAIATLVGGGVLTRRLTHARRGR